MALTRISPHFRRFSAANQLLTPMLSSGYLRVTAVHRSHWPGNGIRKRSSSRKSFGKETNSDYPIMTTTGELAPIDPSPQPLKMPNPREIVDYLNKFVVGQTKAKKALAVGIYQHYKRLEHNNNIVDKRMIREIMKMEEERNMKRKARNVRNKKNFDDQGRVILDYRPTPGVKVEEKGIKLDVDESEMLMEKSNIVLLGPSGSGKTFLTQRLAEVLNVPIAMCDCTTLTQAGYVGEDVDSVISRLLINAGDDIDRAQQGIVFLDEFDKIYSSSDPMHTGGNRDVGGKGVQQALLKMVEGTTVRVKSSFQANMKLEIDTTNILFIASGAFSNLEKIVARRMDQRQLGYGANHTHMLEDLTSKDESIVADVKNKLLESCDHGDLIDFGMVPELVGRFPVLVPFHSLSQQMLVQIMSEPKNNIIDQTKKLFEMDGIKLIFSSSALNEIAKEAARRKTGARALRSILERVLQEAKYDCPGSKTDTVYITDAVVRGECSYFTKKITR